MKNNVVREMSFVDFCVQFPELAANLKKRVGKLFYSFAKDPDYIVKMSRKGIEIGYKEDKWELG